MVQSEPIEQRKKYRRFGKIWNELLSKQFTRIQFGLASDRKSKTRKRQCELRSLIKCLTK